MVHGSNIVDLYIPPQNAKSIRKNENGSFYNLEEFNPHGG